MTFIVYPYFPQNSQSTIIMNIGRSAGIQRVLLFAINTTAAHLAVRHSYRCPLYCVLAYRTQRCIRSSERASGDQCLVSLTTREAAWVHDIEVRSCLSVCLPEDNFRKPIDLGSTYLHVPYISSEYGSSSYMKQRCA